MPREFATMEEILTSVADRLIDRIDLLSTKNCFVADQPLPIRTPPGDLFCTLAPTDGQFSSLLSAGGVMSVHEQTGMAVTMFSRLMLDMPDRADARLLHQQRGLLSYFKPQILTALLVDWEPTAGGEPLLRDQLFPQSSTAPTRIEREDHSLTQMSITFGVSFDWRL